MYNIYQPGMQSRPPSQEMEARRQNMIRMMLAKQLAGGATIPSSPNIHIPYGNMRGGVMPTLMPRQQQGITRY